MCTMHLFSECKLLQQLVNISVIRYDSDIDMLCEIYVCNGCPFIALERTAFSQTFQQYFENVFLNDLMKRMQLKVLSFPAYRIRMHMTKHRTSFFDLNSCFIFRSSKLSQFSNHLDKFGINL